MRRFLQVYDGQIMAILEGSCVVGRFIFGILLNTAEVTFTIAICAAACVRYCVV